MRRTIILLTLLICVASLFASYSRQTALGNGAKFFRDPVNVIYTPGLAPQYGNLIDAELGQFTTAGGTPTGQWAMANLNLNDAIYLGGALRRTDGYAYSLATEYMVTPPNPGFDLWAAYDMGGLGVGLGIFAGGYSEKTTYEESSQEESYKASVMTVKAGVGAEIGDADIEGTLNFSMNSLKEEDTNTDGDVHTWETTGGSEIGVQVRGFIPWGYDAEIVPRVAFSTFSYSLEDKAFDGTLTEYGDYSRMALDAGAALNYTVMEDGIVSVGLAANMVTVKDEIDTTAKTEDKWMTIPEVDIAAEVPAFDWMVLRAGVTKKFIKHTETTDTDETTTSGLEQNDMFVTFGSGLMFGDFALDLAISESFLFYGPNFISGIDNNIAASASLVYYWER